MRALIAAKEQALAAERHSAGRRVMPAARLRKVRWHERPRRPKRSREPLCHTTDPDLKREFVATYGNRLDAVTREQKALKDGSVPRTEIEAADRLGLRGDALTPSRVREAGASEYRPAYVAALLRAADGDTRVLG